MVLARRTVLAIMEQYLTLRTPRIRPPRSPTVIHCWPMREARQPVMDAQRNPSIFSTPWSTMVTRTQRTPWIRNRPANRSTPRARKSINSCFEFFTLAANCTPSSNSSPLNMETIHRTIKCFRFLHRVSLSSIRGLRTPADVHSTVNVVFSILGRIQSIGVSRSEIVATRPSTRFVST